MITILGIYAAAKVYTDVIEPSAEGQIRALCDQQFAAGSKIRIMPDVHTGKGCTIGTTMTVGDFVVPNLVGVDIGCGMDVVRLSEKRINLPELDSFIRKNIPHGRDVRERPHRSHGRIDIDELICIKKVDTRRAKESLARSAAATISSRSTATTRRTSISSSTPAAAISACRSRSITRTRRIQTSAAGSRPRSPLSLRISRAPTATITFTIWRSCSASRR